MSGAPQFIGESHLRVGETDFHYELPVADVPAGFLGIEKPRELLEAYVELWSDLRPQRVVELGIHQGGSTALLSELGGLERIVSIELSDERIDALDRYVTDRNAQDIVRPYFGVNQADRQRLTAIVDEEFRGQPIDLVIDDASHLYEESRASFEVLFPHLRPGGLYILEDWVWQHLVAALIAKSLRDDPAVRGTVERRMVADNLTAPPTAMSRLVLELVLARAVSGDVVAELTIGRHWAMVRRGPAELDPSTFSVDGIAPDDLALLANPR